jgi:hypothetical protein
MQILDNLKNLAKRFAKTETQEKTFKRNVFKEEYKILTGSYRKAVILDHILYNNNLTDWVTKSARLLTEELKFDCHSRTVARDLKELEADELLLSREDKKNTRWDKSLQWQANASVIHERLQAILASADSMPAESPCPMDETQCPSDMSPMSHLKQKHSKSIKKQTTQEPVAAFSPAEIKDLAVENKKLLKRLTSEVKSLKLKPAFALISKFGPEAVENQLNWLPARNAKNPAGMLTKALADGWSAPDDVVEANGHEEREQVESDMMGRALTLLDKLTPGSLIEIGGQLLKFIRRAGNAIMVDAEGYASMPVSILRLADAKLVES